MRQFPRRRQLTSLAVSCLFSGAMCAQDASPAASPDPTLSDQASPTPASSPQPSPTPVAIADYEGRAADAAWRKKATERIDKHRKADITVIVTDAEGKAINEAAVSVNLKQHAFRFGTVVSVEFSPEATKPEPMPSEGEEGEEGDNGKDAKDGENDDSSEDPVPIPVAEMPAGPSFSDADRTAYREKLFDLFNTATPSDESAEIDEKMTAWLKSRGFLFDSEPVETSEIPATFTPDTLVAPEDLIVQLETLEEAGHPLAAHRFSLAVDGSDPAALQLQADYTRDFFTVLFADPKVREISIAGFWEPTSGVPGWALYGADWKPRPVGAIYESLVKRLWSTSEEALTDAAGKAKVRGFLGQYRISVSSGALTQTITADLSADGAEVKIQLE